MHKTIKKIAEFVNEVADEFSLSDETAFAIIACVAGGTNEIPDWIEENVNSCPCCDDEKEDDAVYEDDAEEIVETTTVTIGSQNRVTIPKGIIEAAEKIKGKLDSKKNDYGALTVVKNDYDIKVYFGDTTDDYDEDGISLIYPNAKGQVQFKTAPTFTEGTYVTCSLLSDGTIVLD